MLKYWLLSVAVFLGATGPAAASDLVRPAQLLASYWLDGSAGLDISGLSFCNGELLAVSDKNSADIYSVNLTADSDSAALVPRATFAALQAPASSDGGPRARLLSAVQGGGAADFEGITCNGQQIFVVSERHHLIATANASGETRWLPLRWAKAAREGDFMAHFNGAGEGLVVAGDDLWVALERNRRGLVRFANGAGPAQLLEIPPAPGLNFRGRPEDLTGLAFYDGALYTLERNAFAVCRRSLPNLLPQWCIDYRAIEEAPPYVYQETAFGKGEGLAIDSSGIYVVLDNNNVGRVADPQDRRGLLLKLAHPPVAKAQALSLQ
ncbi:hypothetical protein Maes01_00407 [Microbulbifer aestuariivivens]|uniref:Phytase-like domain-containing protein n=1 Tax=Microbulbifer aestuariivivens TaxID=1908308 RepID=A0ABP9WMN3_9GAMM